MILRIDIDKRNHALNSVFKKSSWSRATENYKAYLTRLSLIYIQGILILLILLLHCQIENDGKIQLHVFRFTLVI